MKIRLEEQEKALLLMKQQFNKLQRQSTETKQPEPVEQLRAQLQLLQKQLQQEGDLKKCCEEQTQKIQFLESELVKSAQVPPSPHSPSNSMMEEQMTQLKKQLEKMQHSFEQLQSQIQSIDVPEEESSARKENPMAISYEIQMRLTSSCVNTSEVYVSLPEPVSKILCSFIKANYFGMIMGGAVRDFLLRKTPADVDIITNMPASILLSCFKEYAIYATPYVPGLYQFSVGRFKIDISCCDTAVFVSEGALMQNALTRAFTVNALYCDSQGRVYDPLQTGLLDLLSYQILRLINIEYSWFEQDPFLLLRGTRLAVQYGLTIPLETKQLMQHFSHLLEKREPKRLCSELKRLFLRGYALKNFEKLMQLDLLKPIFPKTVEFIRSEQGQCYQEWLKIELYKTDQLIIEHTPVSINYIYAIFLIGNVLATLEQPSVSSSTINQSIDKVLTEAFQDQSNVGSLEKVKKMMVQCIREALSLKNAEVFENLSLRPRGANLVVDDSLLYQTGSGQESEYRPTRGRLQ